MTLLVHYEHIRIKEYSCKTLALWENQNLQSVNLP